MFNQNYHNMKKLLCVLAMGAIVMVFASCKRECVCTVTAQDGTSQTYQRGKMSAQECGNQIEKMEAGYAGTAQKIDCRHQ
jgi:hypothetical protein